MSHMKELASTAVDLDMINIEPVLHANSRPVEELIQENQVE